MQDRGKPGDKEDAAPSPFGDRGTPPSGKMPTVGRTKETRRLDKLKDESRNIAKTYKLPVAALKIIEKAGKVHGLKREDFVKIASVVQCLRT